MLPGKYKTKNGSTVEISGQYGGKSQVRFDWLEEENACFDCQPESYAVDGYLVWTCSECGGGKAKLILI
jgi:ribosomal protein L37AE/L43A